jgi:hypothetical protein
MTLRRQLVEKLIQTQNIERTEGLFRAYLYEQLSQSKQLAAQIDPEDRRARREAGAIIAQEIQSLSNIPKVHIPADGFYKAIFRLAFKLSYPLRNTEPVATWRELSELCEQIPESALLPSEIPSSSSGPIIVNSKGAIEDEKGAAYDRFLQEIAKLTRAELERLVVEEGIYPSETAHKAARDHLEAGAAEASWPEFLKAYTRVTGQDLSVQPR